MLDQTWRLLVMPRDGWPQTAQNVLTIWASFIGLGALVFVVFLWMEGLAAARRRAEDKLEMAIKSIDDGFAMYDADDRLLTCNETYKAYYPLSREKMVPGTSFAEIIRYGVDRGEYLDAVGCEDEWFAERMRRHRNLEGDSIQHLADGRWLRVAEKRLPDGTTVGFRVDITELVLARRAAEEANCAKSLFLDQMSHELRTPLAILMGYASFLEHPEKLGSHAALAQSADPNALSRFDQDVSGNARRVNASGRKLLGLIERILDVANIEGDRRAEDVQDVALEDAFESALRLSGQHSARLTPQISLEPGMMLRANEEEFHRAIAALLRHATEAFTEADLSIEGTSKSGDAEIRFLITGSRAPILLPARIFGGTLTDGSVSDPTDLGLDMAIAEQLVLRSGGTFFYRRLNEASDQIVITLPRADQKRSQSSAA